MSDKTIKSELALEEKLIEISNELSSDHSKFVEDLYDFGDMWLLCDIVKEFSKRQSERTSEANGEVSPLNTLVSWLKQHMKERKKALITGDADKTDENLYYYEAFKHILEIAEREYEEAN